MIPTTRYIDAVPGVPLANPQAAMVQGEAMARMGETISAIGEKGFQIAERVRKIDEGRKISAFMRAADEEAATFSLELMRRSDTDKWPGEWKQKASTLRANVHSLGLSPEGKARVEMELSDWTSKRTINFETQAAVKSLELGRAQYINDADHYFRRGDVERGRKTLMDGGEAGLFNPVEIEEGLRRGDEIAAETALAEDIKSDPMGTLARLESGEFLEVTPGADLQIVDRGKRQAQARIQELRGGEMDKLETAAIQGTLKPRDLEAAQFISDRDRAALSGTLTKSEPPSKEEHANAWKVLDVLREAREDPAVTPEQYREIWNEARGDVLARIAPQWQGDLKKELSYLSPAGRSPDGGTFSAGYTREDLEAVGRNIAFRARDAGFFGPIAEDDPPAEREKAFRKAEDVRLEVKRWLSTQREPTPEMVREYTDSLISGDRIKSTARELQSFVPGTGQRFRAAPAMPPLPPIRGEKDKAAADPLEIQPGDADLSDALLPARQQLETFINQ